MTHRTLQELRAAAYVLRHRLLREQRHEQGVFTVTQQEHAAITLDVMTYSSQPHHVATFYGFKLYVI